MLKKSLGLLCLPLLFSFTKLNAQSTWGEYGSRTDYRDNAGLKGSEGATSGFFQTYNPVNYPAGASSWWHLLDVRHSNPANNFAMQFAGSFYDQQLYFRKTGDNPASAWSRVILEGPEGYLSTGKLYLKTPAGQSYFTGHQAGNTYAFGGGVFRAISDNPNGNMNYYYDGVTAGNTNFSVRADGQGYFAGNLGVGASNPESFLHLKSTNRGNDHIQIIRDNESPNLDTYSVYNGSDDIQTGSFAYGVRPSDNSWQVWERHIGADWNNLLTVQANGFVGIGTRTPREELSVNGKIRAREIKVEAAPWPDYVFSKEHKLPTLTDIEEYIKINNHLPEIPAAKEVESEGVSLGEMNAKLLKKIEELTLYMIEQDKKTAELQSKLESQNKVIQQQNDRLNKLEQTQ